MARQFSGFFDSTASVERDYGQAELAAAFRAMGGTGAASLADGLQVSAEGSTMRTLVEPGLAMILGYVYELSDDGGAAMAVEHAASGSSDRFDRVVLRLDLNACAITLELLTGTPGAQPQPPALTRTATVYEISLARVRVSANATAIAQGDITDERPDEGVCGALCPEGVKLSMLWARMEKAEATSSAPGLMSAADKAYLDALAAAVSAGASGIDLGGKYIDNAVFR